MEPTVKEASPMRVTSRFLVASERAAMSEIATLPLVVEPIGLEQGFEPLKNFLSENHERILHDVAKYGAVLFRGFPVDTVAKFEELIATMPTIQGINQILMSEAGRDLVQGTKYVFHTSTAYKTGGTLDFGAFHTENFYVPDVPRYICFYCIKPPCLGGETGLLNVARLFEDMPETLQQKLESTAFLARLASFPEVLNRYSCSAETLERFCADENLPLETSKDAKVIAFYKPAILVHPVTGQRSLCINFAGELGAYGLREALIEAFSGDYTGVRWAAHRMYWKSAILSRIRGFGLAIAIPIRIKVPWAVVRQFIWSRIRSKKAPSQPFQDRRVGAVFSPDDVKNLARLMRKNYSSFKWQRGDVLIVDNLKVAHAGMPGFGSRDLKALMCNRIAMPCTPGAGVFAPRETEEQQTLGAKLTALAKASRTAPPAQPGPGALPGAESTQSMPSDRLETRIMDRRVGT